MGPATIGELVSGRVPLAVSVASPLRNATNHCSRVDDRSISRGCCCCILSLLLVPQEGRRGDMAVDSCNVPVRTMGWRGQERGARG